MNEKREECLWCEAGNESEGFHYDGQNYDCGWTPSEGYQAMGLHSRERDAVLAGLRLLQEKIADGADISNIADIYTDHGKHEGLSEFWIENLCQRINRW